MKLEGVSAPDTTVLLYDSAVQSSELMNWEVQVRQILKP